MLEPGDWWEHVEETRDKWHQANESSLKSYMILTHNPSVQAPVLCDEFPEPACGWYKPDLSWVGVASHTKEWERCDLGIGGSEPEGVFLSNSDHLRNKIKVGLYDSI